MVGLRRVINPFKALVITMLFAGAATANTTIPEARQRSTEPVRIGSYEVYYSAFNSTFLSPQIAASYKLERGPRSGIVNIAVRDVKTSELGKAVTAQIDGQTRNLLSQTSGLDFQEVREGEAIYYLASFRFNNEEIVKFNLNIKPEKKANSGKVEFSQQFFEG